MADGGIGGGMQDLVSTQKSGVNYLGRLVQLLTAAFPQITGSFTMTAAATLAIPNNKVANNSIVFLTPTNASAASMQAGATYLYPQSVTSGVGFTVATASGVGTSGATFSYFVVTPV